MLQYVDYHLPFGSKKNKPTKGVIHAMSEWIIIDEGQSKWFDEERDLDIPAGHYHATEFLKRIRLSPHVLVSPSILIRLREDNQGGYHARGYNVNTIGVEFLVPGIWHYEDFKNLMQSDEDWLSDNQFRMGVDLFNQFIMKWSWPPGSVTTHHLLSPERKYDPGNGFPLERFLNELVII